jgi:hypothetical protein
LPDGGFLRQICEILADLKSSSGQKRFLADSQFLADLINFVWVCFCLADSGGFGAFSSKKQQASHLFCIKLVDHKNFMTNNFKINKYSAKYFQKR